MNRGLDEVFPPTPEVWAELAQHEMAGDHQFGKAVRFLEEGGTDRNLLAERLGIKVDYADWLLNHARKMKRGHRASAYGLFTGVYGIAWFAGSTAIGALFGISLTGVVLFAVMAELASDPDSPRPP